MSGFYGVTLHFLAQRRSPLAAAKGWEGSPAGRTDHSRCRNNCKQKALSRKQELRRAEIKIRDLQKSREKWKIEAKKKEKIIRELEKENQQMI